MDSTSTPGSSDSPTPNSTVSSNTLKVLFADRARRNPDDPYAWAMAHRTLAGRPLIHLPALAEIARDDHPLVVIRSRRRWACQSFWSTGRCTPQTPAGASAVTSSSSCPTRIKWTTSRRVGSIGRSRIARLSARAPAAEPPRRKGADNKRLKLIANGALYLRGADSSRQIASVDADLVILDEYDQMGEGCARVGAKTRGSSRRGRIIVASTPKIPEAGINGLFLRSDQRRYSLPCPKCGLEQPLTWEDNLDLDRALVVCRGVANR